MKRNIMLAYTDGSYRREEGYCGYAAVVIENPDTVNIIHGSVRDKDYVAMWNVGGEIKAVEVLIEYALEQKVDKLIIYHDYIGISEWVKAKKPWKRNKPISQHYNKVVENARRYIEIEFVHVRAHTGNKYNELADKYANIGRLLKKEKIEKLTFQSQN